VASARRRAACSRPAWAWSAPQHAAPGPATSTPTPMAVRTSTAATWTGRCQASMTHPVKSTTSAPVDRSRGRRTGSRSGRPRRRLSPGGSTRARWATAASTDPARRSRGRSSAQSPARSTGGAGRGPAARAARVPSMRCPNGTPEGQAGSQPRHCTQVSTAWAKDASSIATSPPSTRRMAPMRPRGDSASSPVTRHVGQWGRQSPHPTQAASSSASSPSGAVPSGAVTAAPPAGRGPGARTGRGRP
jgi:hypothetical protein